MIGYPSFPGCLVTPPTKAAVFLFFSFFFCPAQCRGGRKTSLSSLLFSLPMCYGFEKSPLLPYQKGSMIYQPSLLFSFSSDDGNKWAESPLFPPFFFSLRSPRRAVPDDFFFFFSPSICRRLNPSLREKFFSFSSVLRTIRQFGITKGDIGYIDSFPPPFFFLLSPFHLWVLRRARLFGGRRRRFSSLFFPPPDPSR